MPQTIFDYLDLVHARPTMYVRSLEDLQSQIWGYVSALRQHNIVEPGPSMGRHFLYFVGERTGWGISSGWAHAIERNIDGLPNQLEKFFSLVEPYRELVPQKLATAILLANHNPTGKRVKIGIDGSMAQPTSVDIVRYQPEPLHFLRFHYDSRFEDGDLLFNRDMGHRTTIDDAKHWLCDEFGVQNEAWQEIR